MFRILSLDGGGIRGAFIAACIARLEAEVRRPMTDFFDLIVGTSTGGIIGVALALGAPASRILDLYRNEGGRIFSKRPPERQALLVKTGMAIAKRKLPSLDLTALYRSKYSQDALAVALTDVYGEKTLGDIRRCRLVITAVDLVSGQTITFKTPHQPGFIRDKHFSAVQVGLATAAAPTYFPQATVDGNGAYTDGGLWANNPSIVAYAEAIRISQVCTRPQIDPVFCADDIWMVSIGTGRPRYYARPGPTDDGLLWWSDKLFDVAAGAQSQGCHFQAEYLMGSRRYVRIDFDMPTKPWALDDVAVLDDLVHLGEQAAVAHFPALSTTFLAADKTAYEPFEQ